MSTTTVSLAKTLKAFDDLRASGSEGEKLQPEKATWEKILHFLNRGTAGSANFFDELIFDEDQDQNPFEAWMEGVFSREGSKVQSFSEIMEKAGWKPDSKAGKALKGIVGFGLDVGLDPSTYLSFGAAPLSKPIQGASQIAGKVSKAAGTRVAFEKALERSPASVRQALDKVFDGINHANPEVRRIAQKALKGEKLTRAEEAKLGVRSVVALQGLFGGPALPLDFGVAPKVYEVGSAVFKELEQAPLLSPVVQTFGRAFERWYDIKKKYPQFFEMRRSLENRLHAVNAEGMRRVGIFLDKVGKSFNQGENRTIVDLLEKPNEEFLYDVTTVIEKTPSIFIDLGYRPGQKLGAEDAAKLVTHWFNQMNDWVGEFGSEGLYRGGLDRAKIQGLNEQIDTLSLRARENEDAIAAFRKSIQGDIPEALKTDVKTTIRTLDQDQKAIQKQIKLLEAHRANLEKSITEHPELHEALDEAVNQQLGTGFYGTVWKPGEDFGKIGFQDWVIKIPRSLENSTTGRWDNIVSEARAYENLEGMPGVGQATLHWQEIPVKATPNQEIIQQIRELDEQIALARTGQHPTFTLEDAEGLAQRRQELMAKRFQYHVPGFQIIPRVPPGHQKQTAEEFALTTGRMLEGEEGLIQALDNVDPKYIRHTSSGEAVLRVPMLVKPRVFPDEKANRLFHDGRLSPSDTRQVVRSIEKIIARASRKGVYLGDMHPDNFAVVRKKGGRLEAEIMDLGYAERAGFSDVLPTDENVMSAWLANMHSLHGLFGDTVKQYILGRNPDAVDKWDDLAFGIDDAMRVGDLAAAKRLMVESEKLLADYGYKLSAMKFDNVLGQTRHTLSTQTKLRVVKSLVAHGMTERSATELVEKRAADFANLRSEVGLVGKVAEGRLDDLERQIEERSIALESMVDPAQIAEVQGDLSELLQEHQSLLNLEAASETIKRHGKLKGKRPIDPMKLLTPEGVEGLKFISQWREELDRLLIDNDLLTQDMIDSFRKRTGLEHLRHFRKQGTGGLKKQWLQTMKDLDKAMQAGNLRPRQVEGTINEINHRMGREFMESNIARIMFLSHNEVGQHVEKWRFLQQAADQFGKPANPVITKVRDKAGKLEDRTIYEATEPGWRVIRGHPVFDKIQLPEEIAKEVENVIGKFREDTLGRTVARYYDKAQNWWKKWALFAWPSYFIRNYAGALWNNFLADVPGTTYEEATDIIMGPGITGDAIAKLSGGKLSGKIPFVDPAASLARKLFRRDRWEDVGIRAQNPSRRVRGLRYTQQELLDLANEHGILAKGLFGSQGEIERGLHGNFISISKNPLRLLDPRADKNTLIRVGMKVSEQMENAIRLGHFMHKLRKGFSPEAAADSVKKFQFDYSDLSDTEKVLKRFPFPFMTWTRKNVPLQAQLSLQRPGKFTAAAKAVGAVQRGAGPPPDQAIIPEWLNENAGTRYRWNPEDRTYDYFLLGSWFPAADLMRIFHPLELSKDMLSPLIKSPLEQVINQSLFFERPLEEYPGQTVDTLSPEAGAVAAQFPGASQVDALLKSTLGRTFPIQAVQGPLEEGVTVRGRADAVLRQFRGTNELRRFLETTSRQGAAAGALSSFVGRSYGFDPAKQKEYTEYSMAKDITALRNEMRKALRKGQASKAQSIIRKIQAKQLELRRLTHTRLPGG